MEENGKMRSTVARRLSTYYRYCQQEGLIERNSDRNVNRSRCDELNAMGERSKTHHFLPQMILRGFARADRVMTTELADGRSYPQPVAKAAAENNYNTVELDGGTQSDLAERFIAEEIEGPAAAVLARIAGGGWFANATDRAIVARFLTLQYVRVPWRRAQSNAMADQLMKLDLAAGGPNQLRRVMEKKTGRPVTIRRLPRSGRASGTSTTGNSLCLENITS